VTFTVYTTTNIAFQSGSTLVPFGAHVLPIDDQYLTLMSLLRTVGASYANWLTNKSLFQLDFEYKLENPGGLC